MTLNPNWPVMEYAWSPANSANGAGIPAFAYTDLTGRTMGRVGTSRGRQYETDQVQAGTLSARLANNDGQLDPMNSAGMWGGHVLPYTPFRVRAQYPPTQNMLTQGAATGGDVGATLGTLPSQNPSLSISSATDNTGGSVAASGSAFQGSNVLQFNIPASTSGSSILNSRIFYALNGSVVPGRTYTFQAQIRNVTPSSALTVAPYFVWFGYGGPGSLTGTYVTGSNATLTGSSSAPWTQVTFTATAPTSGGVYGFAAGVRLTATSPASVTTTQADALQLEQGSTATAFTVPGITYPLYSGFVERWPSKWDFGGTYGVVEPTAVDAFALLSQRQLRDPLTEEIFSRNPRFLYMLGDPQSSTNLSDATGGHPPAQIGASKLGPAAGVTLGGKIVAASSSGVYTGSSATIATVANSNPGTSTPSAASWASLGQAGILGPSSTAWTRMLAFRYTGPLPASGSQTVLWSALSPDYQSGALPAGSGLVAFIDINGHVNFLVQNHGSGGQSSLSGAANINVCDSNWHLLIFGYDSGSGTSIISLDGNSATLGGGSGYNPSNVVSDNVVAYADASGNTPYNFAGDFSYACEWPSLLSATDASAIYAAWRNSCTGDSASQRYSRILGWAGFKGSTSIGASQTASMGPAKVAGQDALSALANVVETENGIHFIDRYGTITFQGRGTRYNSTVPAYTFGENVSAGEWPYEDVSLDFDSTHLANQVTVTQHSTGQAFIGADATSQANYFQRTMSRTVNSSNGLECQDAANYLLSRYKAPLTRVESIKLHPSANPGLWPVCLSLEVGNRIRVMRRPFGAPAIQVDCFIERLQWDLTDQKEATVTLQCSPVDATPYGVFTAFHTTVNGTATAGQSAFYINAPADSTNVLAAQIGQGQRLVIGLGLPTQETVTVLTAGSTSPGWSAGGLNITTPLANNHYAGEVICEPLPSGVTSATTYDASAKFDSAAFSY